MGTVGARAGARLAGGGRRASYGCWEGACKRWALGKGGKSGWDGDFRVGGGVEHGVLGYFWGGETLRTFFLSRLWLLRRADLD